jgi:hypothetical protein
MFNIYDTRARITLKANKIKARQKGKNMKLKTHFLDETYRFYITKLYKHCMRTVWISYNFSVIAHTALIQILYNEIVWASYAHCMNLIQFFCYRPYSAHTDFYTMKLYIHCMRTVWISYNFSVIAHTVRIQCIYNFVV